MTDLAALREALDCATQAVIAIQVGDRDHAREWLHDGLAPAAKAFPPSSPESFGLARVFSVLLEEAAP